MCPLTALRLMDGEARHNSRGAEAARKGTEPIDAYSLIVGLKGWNRPAAHPYEGLLQQTEGISGALLGTTGKDFQHGTESRPALDSHELGVEAEDYCGIRTERRE